MSKKISIIIPCYNEEDNIKPLHDRLEALAEKLKVFQFEFIFVDDASTDQTAEIVRRLKEKDKRVKLIRFSRNFGGHAAVCAGLQLSKGDAVAQIAGDLQDPPEVISEMIQEWELGYKVVWGVRTKREGESFSTKLFSQFYYSLMNWLTPVKMPAKGKDIFLIDRHVVNEFLKLSDQRVSLYMTLTWMGFNQKSIEYVKESRSGGRSNWTLGKKINLVLDSLISFSYVPVRLISLLGLICVISGLVFGGILLLSGSVFEGWQITSAIVLFIGGVQMIMLGYLGEYLWRTYDESRRRPRYITEYVLD